MAPGCTLIGPDPQCRPLTRRSVKVNGLNETLFTSMLYLVVFLVMGIMILWGVWLLDIPG